MAMTKYGPGKFDMAVDAYIYSLDASEEVGSSDMDSYYALVWGPFDPTKEEAEEFGLNKDDVKYLKGLAASIVHENSQGFVTVDDFKNRRDAEMDWESIVDDVEDDVY